MNDDEIMVSVKMPKKKYYSSDIIQSLMTDGQLAYKDGNNFFLMSVGTMDSKKIDDLIQLVGIKKVTKKTGLSSAHKGDVK